MPRRLLLALAFLVTGCAKYSAHPLSATQSASAFAGRSLNDAGLHNFLAEQGAGHGSWTVNRLALAATYFHPDVVLARAEAEEAAAAIKTAAQVPNPVFTFLPQFATNQVIFTPWFFAPSVTIPIETAGKRTRRIEQAAAAAEAARWRVSARAWAARSRVRAAMLEVYGARENMSLLDAEQRLHEEAIKKLTAQMEAGDVSPFELTQARLAVNRTRLALQDARRIAATGEARLAASIGVSPDALRAVTLDFSAFRSLPAIGASAGRRRALTQRADLMALLADYAAADAGLRLELARQYPDVRVSPGYDFNQGQNRWQLGLNVEIPINRNVGPIAQAEARRKTTEARFLAQQNTIQGELETALAGYQASRAKVSIAEAVGKETSAATATTKQLLDAGQVSALELTRRDVESSTARVALMAANIEAQTAAGALEDAMQATLK